VELLVAMAVVLLMVVVLASIVNQTSSIWRFTTGRIEEFRGARDGFEAMTRRLSQATLDTFTDYVDANGNPRFSAATTGTFVPAQYARVSSLRFITGPSLSGSATSTPPRPTHSIFFQAPLGFVSDQTDFSGLENLLNTWGYYIEFNSNGSKGLSANGSGLNIIPSFVNSPLRYRFRLMELMQPSELQGLYYYTARNISLTSAQPTGMNWFTDALAAVPAQYHVLAENIVALVILPKLSPDDISQSGGSYTDSSLSPDYGYDSTLDYSPGAPNTTDPNLDTHAQLPPVVTVTMVAVDETSFKRFQGSSTACPASLLVNSTSSTPLFQVAGDTKNAAKPGFAQDLQTLQNNLQSGHLTYRVFTTDVSIKGAKWSRDQTN